MPSNIPLYPVRPLKPNQQKAVAEFKANSEITYEKIPCLICQSEAYDVLFKNERHGIDQSTVMCKGCGLVYSNPRMDDATVHYFYESDLYRKIYRGVNKQTSDQNLYTLAYNLEKKKPQLDQYYYQLFFDFIHNHDLSYQTVCEIGAGGGWNLMPFTSLSKNIKGYEPSPQLGGLAREKGIDLINGFVDDVEGEYDLVILKHVLEHFQNPIKVLSSLRNHVGKYLFIEVPGIQTMMPSLQNAHTYYFSVNNLQKVTSLAGYKTLDIAYCKSNDFIFGLFEKSTDTVDYELSMQGEIENVARIYRKFKASVNRASFLRKSGIKKVYRFLKGT